MDISSLATKPQLQEIKLDDQEIIDSYGEPITFWMKDHLDLETYFDFYRYQQESSSDQLMNTMRKIILNAEGKQAIADDCILPLDIT
jgi:hypothetical protein